MEVTQEQISRILEGLNIAQERELKQNGYINSAFFNADGTLTKEYLWHSINKSKYIYLNVGSSGAFLINKKDGNVCNIKAYGQVNLNKMQGCIFEKSDLLEFGIYLHSKRWDYRR